MISELKTEGSFAAPDAARLRRAAGEGALEEVRQLLAAGADPFAAGEDGCTAYLVAIAAAKVEVARLLARAEAELGGDVARCSSRRHLTRPFCRAYRAGQLRKFPGWRESAPANPALPTPIGNDSVLLLHRNLTVTTSVFDDEFIVFDGDAPGWGDFCESVLEFHPGDDIDWLQDEQS